MHLFPLWDHLARNRCTGGTIWCLSLCCVILSRYDTTWHLMTWHSSSRSVSSRYNMARLHASHLDKSHPSTSLPCCVILSWRDATIQQSWAHDWSISLKCGEEEAMFGSFYPCISSSYSCCLVDMLRVFGIIVTLDDSCWDSSDWTPSFHSVFGF